MQIKKTAAVFWAAIITLLMTSCGKDHMDVSVYTEAQNMAEASYSSSKIYKWGTGDFSVGDHLLVTYEITNLSSQRANYLVYLKAQQDGINLEEIAFGKISNVFDADYCGKYIDPGESEEITYCFKIKNRTDEITVDVLDMNSNKLLTTTRIS